MEIIALLVLGILNCVQLFVNYKQSQEMAKIVKDKTVVTFPWEQAVQNPDSLVKDEDHVPLDDIDAETFRDAIKKTKQIFGDAYDTVDHEAEQANSEIL